MLLLISTNTEFANSFVTDLNREGFSVEIRRKTKDIRTFLHLRKDIQMLILDLESIGNKTSEIFQRIKQDPKLNLMPIICIIKRDLFIEQLIAFELGADDFIFIPYNTLELQLKMRSIQGLLNLQSQLKEKESRLKVINHTQKVLVTLTHYINNSLTPLYSMAQAPHDTCSEDHKQLKEQSVHTIEFIKKVLSALNNLVQSGEMRVVKQGVYKDLLLDIESKLQNF